MTGVMFRVVSQVVVRLVAGENTGTFRVGVGELYEHILDNRDRRCGGSPAGFAA